MLKRIKFVMEPARLSREEWTEWFLTQERANVLGILIASYGERFLAADLEDVVQEASVVMWKKIMQTDEADRSREGMKRFMVRTCRFMLSHEMRHMDDTERMDAWEDQSRWELVDEMLQRDDETDRMRHQRYERLMDCWDRLSETNRQLLTKYYWEDKSMADIALEMGLKNDKVAKNYKGRAMKLLKDMLRLKQKQ